MLRVEHHDGRRSPASWAAPSSTTAVVCLIAAGAALTDRETKDVPTVELGLPRSEPAPKLGYPTASVAA